MNEQKKELTLKYSIPIPTEGGGVAEVNKLKMGRLKLKHLRLLPENFVEKEGKIEPKAMIPLIAGIMDIPEEAAGEIDFEDIDDIANALLSFLAESPLTGKK